MLCLRRPLWALWFSPPALPAKDVAWHGVKAALPRPSVFPCLRLCGGLHQEISHRYPALMFSRASAWVVDCTRKPMQLVLCAGNEVQLWGLGDHVLFHGTDDAFSGGPWPFFLLFFSDQGSWGRLVLPLPWYPRKAENFSDKDINKQTLYCSRVINFLLGCTETEPKLTCLIVPRINPI